LKSNNYEVGTNSLFDMVQALKDTYSAQVHYKFNKNPIIIKIIV